MNDSQQQQPSPLWIDLSDAESEKLVGGMTLPFLQILSSDQQFALISFQNRMIIFNQQFAVISSLIKNYSDTKQGTIANIK